MIVKVITTIQFHFIVFCYCNEKLSSCTNSQVKFSCYFCGISELFMSLFKV
jgi:hypothetical protein